METEKLYALHPGCVTSAHDGQDHYISAHQLARLYQIGPGKWIKWDSAEPETFMGRKPEDYIHLGPRPDGNYSLKGPH